MAHLTGVNSYCSHCGPSVLVMSSRAVALALEKAAQRAARIAEQNALGQNDDEPRHPTNKMCEQLEKAKESSRPGGLD